MPNTTVEESARGDSAPSDRGTGQTPASSRTPGPPTAFQNRLRHSYYDDLYSFIRQHVVKGSRVLDLGCGDGSLLASLRPQLGVGIDISQELIDEGSRRFPELKLICGDITELTLDPEPFDYIVVSNTLGYLDDVQGFLAGISKYAHPSTRLIFTHYNFVWEPVLKLAQRVRLKRTEPLQNWISRIDLLNLLEMARLQPIESGHRTIVPVGPRWLARRVNRILEVIPIVRRMGLTSYAVARPVRVQTLPRKSAPTCTVVIPTRNERGNVKSAIARMPRLGSHTEIIFVDGNSTDGTVEEIEAVAASFPEWDIKLLHQGDGVGKGDAVRKGFAVASGDVLMILDADLTVPPEELPKFFSALVEERGEFINGTRLVYPMESQAMRLANIAGNKFFSMVFSWILGQRITDTLCGTKVLWAEDYRRIQENRHLFGDFDPFGDFDLLFGASNLDLELREIPIRYAARTYGSTNISRWRHGVTLLRMAARGARIFRFR